MLRTSSLALAFALALATACGGGSNGTEVDPPIVDPDDPPPVPDPTSLTWSITTLCGDATPSSCEAYGNSLAAGYQNKLVLAPDGTIYVAYLKYQGDMGTCDIANFGGDAVPNSRYDLKLARRAVGQTYWQIEDVPLANVPATDNLPYLAARYGLDGLYDAAGDALVLAFAAGGPGLASCGSSDLVLARRTSAGVWSFQVPAADSNACCTVCTPSTSDLACCEDPACTAGTDVGAWAAVAQDDGDAIGVAFTDYHNYWDSDGYDHVGYELWESGAGVRGIRPWSGKGDFGDLVYAGAMPVAAYTSYGTGGLFVARRTGASTADDAWEEQDLASGWRIGERINLARAPDGTLGLAAFVASDASGALNDLVYSSSSDDGATWIPFELVEHQLLDAGRMPSLAFDSGSRPGVSYQHVGTTTNDTHFAWRESDGHWTVFEVDADASRQTGYYSQLVFDPATDAPIVVYQDLTRGAVMIAEGALP